MGSFKEKVYQSVKKKQKDLILVADIGGTTTDFGVLLKTKKKIILLVSLHFKSKEIKNFTKTVEEVFNYLRKKYHITVKYSCFAGAGVVSSEGIELTNLSWNVNSLEVKKRIKLKSVTAINDFQAIAYGIQELSKKSIVLVKKGKKIKEGAKVLIGAGTGLGKGILLFDQGLKRHIAFPAEGGHGDLPVLDKEEFKLREFINRNNKNKSKIVEWEDVLSGKGLRNIYLFLKNEKKYKTTKYSLEIEKSNYDSMLITKYKNKDKLCKDTFLLFLKFYGRCAKNFALDVLAEGGIYIGGGIAAKNSSIFNKKIFSKEFVRNEKQQKLLEKIPIYVIKDYNISLYGAAVAALRNKDLEKRGIRT